MGRIEYGDFQTPPALAVRVATLLRQRGCSPAAVLEPTCGAGAFVDAALDAFPDVRRVDAYDLNPDYVQQTRTRLARRRVASRCEEADIFAHDWRSTLAALSDPILILGNPPWVTASGLGALGSSNAPRRENAQKRRGIDALTGSSNFDVAEWLLLKLLEAGHGRDVTLAMLVKTSVVRRVLAHAWGAGLPMAGAEMLAFDAGEYFGVNAAACLFVCRIAGRAAAPECRVSSLDEPDRLIARLGWRDGVLVSHAGQYDGHRSLLADPGEASPLRWRSGVKHDCSPVMALRRTPDGTLVDGAGAALAIEPDYLFPLLKGADLANGRLARTDRWLLVTQAQPGDDTSVIARRAPHTWAYLNRHADRLDARRSAIYRNRPRFSVFGVGPYTFAPWKVAISALHKRLSFAVVGPIEDRPAVFDDTCYHLACESERDAMFVRALLESQPAEALLTSMIFWDAKRPITADLLQRVSLRKTARAIGRESEFDRLGAPSSRDTVVTWTTSPTLSSV